MARESGVCGTTKKKTMADVIENAAIHVNGHRGSGWRETHIEAALAAELHVQGLVVVRQPTVPATFRLSNGIEIQVGSLRPDLLVRTSRDGLEIEQFYVEIKVTGQGRTANVSRAHMDQAEGYATQTGIPCVALFFHSDMTVSTMRVDPPNGM